LSFEGITMTTRRNFIFHVIPAASIALVTSRIASA
jgi:hypothetical protein